MATTHLLDRDQLESLTMPIRLAIVQRLENDKTASARELAARMGRPVTSLYHHLKQLEAIGLVRVVGERRGPRRPEAVYAMVADYVSTKEAVRTVEGCKSYARAAMRVAEAAARAFSVAVDDGQARFDGDERNATVRFFMFRADGAELARINALITELEAALRDGSSNDGEEIMFSFIMSPQQLTRHRKEVCQDEDRE